MNKKDVLTDQALQKLMAKATRTSPEHRAFKAMDSWGFRLERIATNAFVLSDPVGGGKVLFEAHVDYQGRPMLVVKGEQAQEE